MPNYFKLILSALLLAGAVAWFIAGDIGWGIIMIFFAAIPVIFFFFNEFLLLALWKLRKQNTESAGKWLTKIKNPDTQLHKAQRGYYYYLTAICSAEKGIGQTESLMKKALSLGLRFDHDKAVAYVNLAAAALAKGRKPEAEKYLAEAKKMDKAGMVDDQIKYMKQQMKKVQNQPGGYFNPNMRRR